MLLLDDQFPFTPYVWTGVVYTPKRSPTPPSTQWSDNGVMRYIELDFTPHTYPTKKALDNTKTIIRQGMVVR